MQQGLYSSAVRETERWWPALPYGMITQEALAGTTSAIRELAGYASKLAIVRGLKHPVGTQSGHREGYIQGLTGAGVRYPDNTPNVFVCDPKGESLDNRIARQLTPASPYSLYLGVGSTGDGGQRGDAGISFLADQDALGAQITRACEENFVNVFNRMFLPVSTNVEATMLLQGRRRSVNDLVRENLAAMRKDPRLSKSDQDRLSIHMDSIRDAEVALQCLVPSTFGGDMAAYQAVYAADRNSCKGNSVVQCGDALAKLVSLAIVCGTSRSVLISMGPPSDTTPYNSMPDTKGINFHDISHRHTFINEPELLHHAVDRFHLRIFRGILDALSAHTLPDGSTYLDQGVCTHYSDIGSGAHSYSQLPYLYVGGAGGALETGVYADVSGQYAVRLLNTIGAAVGCRNANGDPLDDFNADNNGHHTGRLDSLVAG